MDWMQSDPKISLELNNLKCFLKTPVGYFIHLNVCPGLEALLKARLKVLLPSALDLQLEIYRLFSVISPVRMQALLMKRYQS